MINFCPNELFTNTKSDLDESAPKMDGVNVYQLIKMDWNFHIIEIRFKHCRIMFLMI
ncbi:hypothetical protein BKA69DRAFT_1078120 [Paraphysoderma sedebokerense]|nr:hypothetical protein BKA69DRAFT_1078120 [Paraphysoderma sedebokerense]